MKYVILSLLLNVSVFANDKVEDVTNMGNSNVNNICKPIVIVKTNKKTCNKVKYKVKYKTKYKVKYKIVEKEINKNSIRVLGGHGVNGLKSHTNDTSTTVSQNLGIVLGIGYTRLLNKKISVEVNALSNDTYLFGVGFHF